MRLLCLTALALPLTLGAPLAVAAPPTSAPATSQPGPSPAGATAAKGSAAPAGKPAPAEVAEAVHKAYAKYQLALLSNSSENGAEAVDRGTIAYYQRMRDLALEGSEPVVRALPLMDKIVVLRLRHEVPLSELKAMDGKSTVGYAIRQGWVGKANVGGSDLGDVTVDGNVARGPIVLGGKASPVQLEFRKEEGRWRVSLTSLFAIGQLALSGLQRNSGLDEDAFILQLLGDVSKRPVDASVWKPAGGKVR
jgi:hypothetical protein